MKRAELNWITGYIWGIADDVLRDLLLRGIDAFLRREVLPYAPHAWYESAKVKIGYEIDFNRHFYRPKALRALEEIRADILALEKETEGLLGKIIGGSAS